MATTFDNSSSTFAGEHAGKYISAALLSGTTLGNEEVTIEPNVRYKKVVGKMALGGVISDATCAFTDNSSVTLTEMILEPKELQVNLQLCKKDIVDGWEALEMGFSAFHEMPSNFTDYLLTLTAEKVAEEAEGYVWTGAGTTGTFKGLMPQLVTAIGTGNATALNLNSTAVSAVTSANVLTRLGAMLDVLPNEVYGKQDLRFYVAPNVAKAYMRVLGGFASGGVGAAGFQDQGPTGVKPLNFDGVDLVMCPGMTASTMVLTYKSNLYFGTGLMNDWNEVRVIDMADIDGSQNYRVIMRFTAGTQVAFKDEIVTDGIVIPT
jgi:hypothetical protein